VAEGIRASTSCEVELKWPNDLLAKGSKLGGILTEARTQGERTYVAIGVGVDVFDVPGSWNGLPGATTIERAAGGKPSSSRLLQAIIEAVDDFFAMPRWDRIRQRWLSLSIHRQDDILRVRNGETEVAGKYRGIDERGFLKLETEDGEIRVLAGEVTSW
jgi:biotin---[acetyl-CoA-carboxylase] ligase / type III pantothenate kinase